jgi:23S rRNA (pseudouridine1915-N3)-methyltransferase
MKITVYSIEKSSKDNYKSIEDELLKMSSKFAEVRSIDVNDKNILKAVKIGVKEAKESYTKAYEPLLKGANIAMDESGESLGSNEFSNIFDGSKNEINFFIGGAYGFEKSFLSKCERVISLSPMTFGHKLARVALFEQIFRGLAIKNNHPYHKQ